MKAATHILIWWQLFENVLFDCKDGRRWSSSSTGTCHTSGYVAIATSNHLYGGWRQSQYAGWNDWSTKAYCYKVGFASLFSVNNWLPSLYNFFVVSAIANRVTLKFRRCQYFKWEVQVGTLLQPVLSFFHRFLKLSSLGASTNNCLPFLGQMRRRPGRVSSDP